LSQQLFLVFEPAFIARLRAGIIWGCTPLVYRVLFDDVEAAIQSGKSRTSFVLLLQLGEFGFGRKCTVRKAPEAPEANLIWVELTARL
jgi:hypothetical protein